MQVRLFPNQNLAPAGFVAAHTTHPLYGSFDGDLTTGARACVDRALLTASKTIFGAAGMLTGFWRHDLPYGSLSVHSKASMPCLPMLQQLCPRDSQLDPEPTVHRHSSARALRRLLAMNRSLRRRYNNARSVAGLGRRVAGGH